MLYADIASAAKPSTAVVRRDGFLRRKGSSQRRLAGWPRDENRPIYFPSSPQLDFIAFDRIQRRVGTRKMGSAREDFMGAVEGEPEASEVAEGAPALLRERPVQKFQTVRVGHGLESPEGAAAGAVIEGVAATRFDDVQILEGAGDLDEKGIGR